MKFCYLDESGNGNEPIFVMAGIVTDVSRMHRTKNEWRAILESLATKINKPISEFHTRHFYRGRGIWHDLDGEQRKKLMDVIVTWIKERRHQVVFSAIDKGKCDKLNYDDKPDFKGTKPYYWRLAALHIFICLQKEFQKLKKNKGHTLCIFDNESSEEEFISKMVLDAPQWTDTFYEYNRSSRSKKNCEPLSHIVDVPYFADSKHVGMLQIADLFAYLIRHFAELKSEYTAPKYSNELNIVTDWIKEISSLTLPDSNRWTSRGACNCSMFFKGIAPEVLLKMKSNCV